MLKRYKKGDLVNCDFGYQTNENWQVCKVISCFEKNQLFSKEKKLCLLVEAPGGERIHVDYWRDIQKIT